MSGSARPHNPCCSAPFSRRARSTMDAAAWARGARLDESATRLMTKPRRPRRKPLDPARQAAFDVLRAVSERDAYANLVLPGLLRDRGITGRDAAFATELAYGTCRTRGLLDAVIAEAAGRPPDHINPVLLDLLRLGHLPAAPHPCRRARRGVHHRRAGRDRIRLDASRIRQRRTAHHLQAGRSNRGSMSSPHPPTPTPSATWPSCTPIRGGSPRPSRMRSARGPANSTRCCPPTTTGRWCISPPAPAC